MNFEVNLIIVRPSINIIRKIGKISESRDRKQLKGEPFTAPAIQ